MKNLIFALCSRLHRALDANFCPIDLSTVLDVITQLEQVAHISRYDLESTRLARFINGLRRQTKDDILSSRCKILLKKWRLMVSMDQPNQKDILAAPGAVTPTVPTTSSIPIGAIDPPPEGKQNLVNPADVVQQGISSVTDDAIPPSTANRDDSVMKIKKHKKKHHKKKTKKEKHMTPMDAEGEAKKKKKKKSKKHKKHKLDKKEKSLDGTAENPGNDPYAKEMNVKDVPDSSMPSVPCSSETLDLTPNSEFVTSTKSSSTPIHPVLIPASIVPAAAPNPVPPLTVAAIDPPVVKKKRGRKKLLKNMLPSEYLQAFGGPPPTSLFMDIKPNILWKDGRKMKTLRDILVDLKSHSSVPSDIYDTLLPPPSPPPPPPADVIETAVSSALIPLSLPAQNDETLGESLPEVERVVKSSIDEEIKFIYSQLPPINYEALNEIEEDEVVCTCVCRDNVKATQNDYNSCENITVVIKDNDDIPEASTGNTNENIMFMQSSTLNTKKRQKSIFDLDYNESDDTFANVETGTNLETVDTTNKIADYLTSTQMQGEQQTVAIPLRLGKSERSPSKWECEEDPNCPAAKRFCKRDESELNQQIDYLNNNFVPNVNGNFSLNVENGESQNENDRSEQRSSESAVPAENIRDVADAVNCVPKYDELQLSMPPKTETSETAATTKDAPDVQGSSEGISTTSTATVTNASDDNSKTEKVFKEWTNPIQVKSYKDETLTILPYCIID